jgi:hypothetical protein
LTLADLKSVSDVTETVARARNLRSGRAKHSAIASLYRRVECSDDIPLERKAALLVRIMAELRACSELAEHESGVDEFLRRHQGCLEGTCGASRRAS